jgi:phage terminase Nu1 subunit (DNA packaging protein)
LAEKKLAKAEAKALKEAEEKLKVISSFLSTFFLFATLEILATLISR